MEGVGSTWSDHKRKKKEIALSMESEVDGTKAKAKKENKSMLIREKGKAGERKNS